MYIEPGNRTYYKGTEQRSRRGRFLILMTRAAEQIEVACPSCKGLGHKVVECTRCGDPRATCILAGTCGYEDLTWWLKAEDAGGAGWASVADMVLSTVYECDYGCYGKGRLKQYEAVDLRDVRAVVRDVALRQLGHWMTGQVRISGHPVSLSGAYGADGLTREVPRAVFELGVPLPPELYEAWSKGGGHNSAGSAAPDMAQWARDNLKALSPQKRRGKKSRP